ncbi:Hypothetical protein, putative [Bodo saltans]|uniref:Uncharacterized protein n=1 Tax=Bodo saltans TaxID=75058 RepID=A0A0S4JJ13_BODSA|nr:Hypothetical protein, putative [Bodo saltans]|eukprot:CUG89381.1 Hypothetical protein, putative [Bodo saltans]
MDHAKEGHRKMNIQHHIKISYMYECARGGKNWLRTKISVV